MEIVTVVLMIAIGAGIGWVTNIMAIKLLFRPIQPYRIPLIGYEIQGLLPRRKAEVAANIGKTVEEELISIHEILEQMIHEEDKIRVIRMVQIKVEQLAEEHIPFLVPLTIKNLIIATIQEVIERELSTVIDELAQDTLHRIASRIKIRSIVEEKINSYEFEKIESIVISIAQKELKHIERLGGLLGGIIGLIQGILVILI